MKDITMLEETMSWLMQPGSWQHTLWFFYVTFHDLAQWFIMGLIGLTAYGQRKHKKELQELVDVLYKELNHVHDEVHEHIKQDFLLHKELGQDSMRLPKK